MCEVKVLNFNETTRQIIFSNVILKMN